MSNNNNEIHAKCQNRVRQINILRLGKGVWSVKKGPRKYLRKKKTQTSRKERIELHRNR